MTELLFRNDAYARRCEASVTAVNDRGGIVLDRTVFYAMSGGQPGDKRKLVLGDSEIGVTTTVYGDERSEIVHVPAELPPPALKPNARVTALLDWDLRYRHMRAHTALHLLCALVKFPVTGGQIAADGGRLDFDIPDPSLVDRAQLETEINRLIREDHPVTASSISDSELARRPELVRTMAVKPPMGSGIVRLVLIGEGGAIDLQPCGGTHVRSTAEIGAVTVGKLESKGKQNRRIRLTLV
jgi:misacylated tRNA(Ala) deacylase